MTIQINDRQVHVVKATLYATSDPESEAGYSFGLIAPEKRFWLSDDDVVIEKEVTAYVDPPEGLTKDAFVRLAVETLRDKQVAARAEAEMHVQRLQKKIDQLLQITYVPKEVIEP